MPFTNQSAQATPAPAASGISHAGNLGANIGNANGFDTIRLLAAMAVLISHAFALTGSPEPMSSLPGNMTLGTLAVATFFVISGFLISISFDRGTVLAFIFKRVRRIIPGLAVAVLLSIFVLGFAISTFSPSDYLINAVTWQYLGHILFIPSPNDLPGVFKDNPLTAVNGSLWTLKFEVACYAFVALALSVSRSRARIVFLAWIGSFILARFLPPDSGGVTFYVERIAFLFRFFGSGMLFYLYRDQLPLRSDLATIALIMVVISAFTPAFVEFCATLGAYALLVFAYRSPAWFCALTRKGDISYGVYVYAFPIQQSLVPLSLAAEIPWLANALLSLPLTFVAGLASWILVEKPALARIRSPLREAPV